MTKGHNKGRNNDMNPESKGTGQDGSLSSKDRKRKNDTEGRGPEKDPSEGRKKNSNAVG